MLSGSDPHGLVGGVGVEEGAGVFVAEGVTVEVGVLVGVAVGELVGVAVFTGLQTVSGLTIVRVYGSV